MSFLSRLFSGTDPMENSPVRDWPPSEGQSPQVSLDRQALESFSARVSFGVPLDAIRPLGRPDVYESSREGFGTLTYNRWGLQLEIELGKFVQAAFLIGELHRRESRPGLVLAEPRGTDGRGLSMRTTQDDLVHRFGTPDRLQDLGETVILCYNAGPLVSEYELREGFLTGWDVYLD